jgi:hypothetical protein
MGGLAMFCVAQFSESKVGLGYGSDGERREMGDYQIDPRPE